MDYKEMYLKLFEATEKAINILNEAQRECEKCYSEVCGDSEFEEGN